MTDRRHALLLAGHRARLKATGHGCCLVCRGGTPSYDLPFCLRHYGALPVALRGRLGIQAGLNAAVTYLKAPHPLRLYSESHGHYATPGGQVVVAASTRILDGVLSSCYVLSIRGEERGVFRTIAEAQAFVARSYEELSAHNHCATKRLIRRG